MVDVQYNDGHMEGNGKSVDRLIAKIFGLSYSTSQQGHSKGISYSVRRANRPRIKTVALPLVSHAFLILGKERRPYMSSVK